MRWNEFRFRGVRFVLALTVAGCMLSSAARGQEPVAVGAPLPGDGQPLAQAVHPLTPALEVAYRGMQHIQADIKDYSCTLIKRERINDKLGEHEFIFAKIRHEPFSVYMYFMGPPAVEGREVIYVHGANDGKLIAHEGSGLIKIIGTVRLKPNSAMAMKDNRYPITDVGIGNLTRRLIEVAENDKKFGECEVKQYTEAKVEGRVCTLFQVVHPVPRRNFLYHVARVFVDDELLVPIRFEAYDWPKDPSDKEPSGKPLLVEEYTYTNIKLNVGLTDADFDPRNPNYKFNK